jgi:hypothetical protein
MIFDFKCRDCGRIEEDVYLPLHHTALDHPDCHGPMEKHFTSVPMVHWKDYELRDGGFKAAHDGTVITTRKQNLEYMKRHGLQDANEMYEKPTYESEQAERAKMQEEIDAITPTAQELDMLKDAGIVDSQGDLIE